MWSHEGHNHADHTQRHNHGGQSSGNSPGMPSTLSMVPGTATSNLMEEKMRQFMDGGQAGNLSSLAQNFVNMMEGPNSGGGWEDMARTGIQQMLSSGGMTPAEKAMKQKKITSAFNAKTRSLAGGAAGRGFLSEAGVAQGAGNEPSQVLAEGLMGLEAEDARMQRRGVEQGMGSLASMLPTLMQGNDAYGSMMGELFNAEPLVFGSGAKKRTMRIPNSRPMMGGYA